MAENNKHAHKKSKKTKKGKSKNNYFKIIMISLLIIFVMLAVSAGGLALAVIKTAPDLDINQIINANETSRIYDDEGKLMDSIITPQKKILIKYEDMPENLIDAFVSIEDERFFKHNGVDIKRVLGSVFADVKNTVKGKSSYQGGSTITQQLIKTKLYNYHSETFWDKVKRKIQEWYLAPQLEKKVGKEAILEAYLNTIFLGGRAIGVEAASQQYFGTSAKNLNLVQCSFIAGLTRSPSVYYPYSKTSLKNPNTYIKRTKTVLAKMKENGYIDDKEYNDAIAELNTNKASVTNKEDVQTLGHSVLGKASSNDDKYNFEWFTRPVVEQVKEDLKETYDYSEEEIENLLVNGGLKIYSTMDRDLQVKAQKILDEDEKLNQYTRTDDGTIHPQASVVIVDYHTGNAKVIIGGRGNQPAMAYNRAMDAKVPTGSSIKPLTVYSPAIDTKLATAATVIEDSPLSPEMAKKYGSNGKLYQPENSDGTYGGYINLREAVRNSVNLYAIKLEDRIGLDTGYSYGLKYGLQLDEVDKSSIASLALGELNKGTNTFTMANAYGVFGNNGLYTTPKLYTKVLDKNDQVLLESKTETTQVISPQAAYIMYDILKEPVRSGTASRANNSYNSGTPLAGKTGSSTNYKNLWFCGLTPYYSGAIWIENKYQQPIYSSHAAYLFGKIMNEAVKDLPVKDIEPPSGITSAAVDRVSGLLPSELSYKDPRGSQVYTEIFIDGTVPTATDNIHVEVAINKLTGKIASQFTPSFLIEKRVYIRRDYTPSVELADQAYVLPKEIDDTVVPNQNNGGPSDPNGSLNNNDDKNNGSQNGDNTNPKVGDNPDEQNNDGNNDGDSIENSDNEDSENTNNPPKPKNPKNDKNKKNN